MDDDADGRADGAAAAEPSIHDSHALACPVCATPIEQFVHAADGRFVCSLACIVPRVIDHPKSP